MCSHTKHHFALIFLFFISTSLFAQNSVVKRIDIMLENWAHFHAEANYNKAVEQAEKAYELAKEIQDKERMAIALNREGKSLLEKKRRTKKNRKRAEECFKRSLFYLATIDNMELRMDNLNSLKRMAALNKKPEMELVYEKKIKELEGFLATHENNEVLESKLGLLAVEQEKLTDKVETLTEAQTKSELLIALQKNQVDSFRFINTKDSLLLEQKELILAKQTAQLSFQESQLELQESEIRLQQSQRNFFLALAGIIALLAIASFLRYSETKKHNNILEVKNEIIEEEKKKSEQLLLNILPAVVATELKTNGMAKARKYENATVLFSDFKNFSSIAESLTPERLVSELDYYFKTFDDIIGKYNLEKIKTIGDAYMCVGGLPEEKKDHPRDVIMAALEIQSYLNAWKLEREMKNEPYFEARMGIHTGPLVAGVVGSRKFAYDIWGDTVNVAARLESKSEAGKVNISASTYQLINEEFDCESRGVIPIKNRGEIEMFFVKGLNQEF
jgi:class 3 adenylate cyclase